MDDRALFRFPPATGAAAATALDWSDWGGFGGAVEMCNNNGACRKSPGLMCPSFRATRDEQHVTRGRANTLRLALSGQLGPDAFASDEMARRWTSASAARAAGASARPASTWRG